MKNGSKVVDINTKYQKNYLVKPIPCVIVLCRPEDSRNVGSVCRAMKTMNCYDLRIVGQKENYNEEQIRNLSVHAYDVWQNAQFFNPSVEGLKESLSDCIIAAGTTRRMGQKRKHWGMTPEQFATFTKNSKQSTFAVVFGNERTGLTDAELKCCSVAVNIPTSEQFPSLNLAHAVQIMTYTLFRNFDHRKKGYDHIPLATLNELVEKISNHMDRIGIYTHQGREENELFLEGILARASLSAREAQQLEKIFRKMAYIKTGYAPAE